MEYAQAFFLYVALIKLGDILAVWGAWHLVWYVRFYSQLLPVNKGVPEFEFYSKALVPLLLVHTAVFHIVGAYRRDRVSFGFRSLRKIVQGSLLGTLVFIAICYFLYQTGFSRIFLAIFPLVAAGAILAERLFVWTLWLWAQDKVVRHIRILLIGSGDLLQMYLRKLNLRKPYPIDWVGRIGSLSEKQSIPQLQYLGDEKELSRILHEEHVDMVVVSYPSGEMQRFGEILGQLSHELVTVKVLPDFGKYSTFAYSADQELGIPHLVFNQAPLGSTDRAMKRGLDIAISGTALVLLSPVYVAIAVAIQIFSKGPVMYTQVRVGADGRRFTLYKFRSMSMDAERKTGAVWATKDDPRTTRFGKWLRQTSLDELPQFFNVLKGDMSLVGPRPERPVFVEQFRKEVPKYMLRHKMKSGITGWAQVNGWRGNTSIEERIKHDLFYIGHWSHYLDFKILLLTLLRGFRDRNAY